MPFLSLEKSENPATATEDRQMVSAVKKKHKATVCNLMNNLQRAGVETHSPLFKGHLENNSIEAILHDANHSWLVKIRKPDSNFQKKYRD